MSSLVSMLFRTFLNLLKFLMEIFNILVYNAVQVGPQLALVHVYVYAGGTQECICKTKVHNW